MGSRQIVSGSIGGNYLIITYFIALRFILSMLTEHNKPSHQTKDHPFTLGCQRLRHFTKPGTHELRRRSMLTFGVLWVMQPPRLQSITTRLQHRMLLSLLCVGCCVSTDNLTLTSFSVLNPQMKMKHFKKHWSLDLQVKVRDVAEEVVRLLSRVHHDTWY